MRPLTDQIPKALVPLAGKPLLQRAIETLTLAGIDRIAVGLGWLKEEVKDMLSSIDVPAEVTMVDVHDYQRGPLETLVATSNQLQSEEFLVTPVDALVSPDDVAGLMVAHGEVFTLATDFATSSGSRVFTDDSGTLVGIGKSIKPYSREGGSAMMFMAKAEFLDYCRSALDGGHSRVLDVMNQALQRGVRARAYPMVQRWFDVDTILDLIQVNSYLLSESLRGPSDHIFVPTGDVMEIGEELRTRTGIHLNRGTHLYGPMLLAPGCVVGADAKIGPDVFLDENTRVGSGCHLKRLVASGESTIPDGMLLENVVMFRSKIHSGGESDSK